MIPMFFEITEAPPAGVAARRWPGIAREGMRAAGDEWQASFLEFHFAPFAKVKYRYQPRSARYLMRKEMLGRSGGKVERGGRIDLVLSGLLEELVTGHRHITKAFPTRFSVDMFVPSYASRRPRGNRPNIAAELTATTTAENNRLAKVIDAVTTKLVNELRETQTTRIG